MNTATLDDSEDDLVFSHQDREELTHTRPLHRAVLRDARLTFAARALFFLVYDFPANFRVNKKQLEKMTSEKTTTLPRLFKELRKIGAFSYEPRRLSDQQASVLNQRPGQHKRYRAGNVCGQIWIVHHPKNWAIEHDLRGNPLKPLPEGEVTV